MASLDGFLKILSNMRPNLRAKPSLVYGVIDNHTLTSPTIINVSSEFWTFVVVLTLLLKNDDTITFDDIVVMFIQKVF